MRASGSVSHSTGIFFNSVIKAKPTMVAYRGTGPALNDLMGNTVDYMTDQIVNVAPQIQGGNIKAFAIATPSRSPALPDVPTTKEAGLDGYEVSAWNAIFAPKGTPPEIVTKLNDALVKSLERREHQEAPARPRRRDSEHGRTDSRRPFRSWWNPRSPAGPRSSRLPAPPPNSRSPAFTRDGGLH